MRHPRQRGSVIVLIAISSLLLVAFVGLVVDGGEVTAQGRASQNAADSAALGAAYELLNGDTVAQATALARVVAGTNGIPIGDLTLTYLDASGSVLATCTSTCSAAPSPTLVKTVKGDVTHVFPTLFLPIINIDSAVVVSHAAVTVTAGGGGCAICIMNPSLSGSLAAGGSAPLSATGGGIAVNSTSASAVTGPVSAPAIAVTGGWTGCTCNPTPVRGGPFPDPLASVAPLAIAGPSVGNFSGSGTINPGIYGSITATGNLTMAPGNYVVTGAMTIASGNFTANNVFIYFGCSSYPTACNVGQSGGYLNLTSAGVIRMSPPAFGTWSGMLLFSDRNNVAGTTLAGTSDMGVQGTIYSLAAKLTVNGDGLSNNVGGTRVIVDRLVTTGGGSMTLSYVPSQNYVTPSKLTLTT